MRPGDLSPVDFQRRPGREAGEPIWSPLCRWNGLHPIHLASHPTTPGLWSSLAVRFCLEIVAQIGKSTVRWIGALDLKGIGDSPCSNRTQRTGSRGTYNVPISPPCRNASTSVFGRPHRPIVRVAPKRASFMRLWPEIWKPYWTCLMGTEDGPFTLAYLAGHSDISITKRYVHPEDETVSAAMERAASEHLNPPSTPPSRLPRRSPNPRLLLQSIENRELCRIGERGFEPPPPWSRIRS